MIFVMKPRFVSKLIILPILFLVLLTGYTQAADLDAKGFVNGSDVDNAAEKSGAIVITEPLVNGAWDVKNNKSASITFTGASLDYAGLLPDSDFSFDETIAPGGVNKGSGSTTLPDYVFLLKGSYQIKVQAFAGGNEPVIAKTFWVKIGEGSPLAGLPGGIGAVLSVLALLGGIIGAVKGMAPLRILATPLALLGLPLLMLAFGVPSALNAPLFLGVWLGGVVVYTIALKLLAGAVSPA